MKLRQRTQPLWHRVFALLILCLALPNANAQSSHDFRDQQLTVSAHCPWPSRLDKGYLPIFVVMSNRSNRAWTVNLEAQAGLSGLGHSAETTAQVPPRQTVQVELFAPVSAHYNSRYSVEVSLDRGPFRRLNGIGAGDWPSSNGGYASRELIYIADSTPDPSVIANWQTKISTTHGGRPSSIMVGGVKTPVSSPNNCKLVHVSPVDMPSRFEPYTSLDAVVLDTSSASSAGQMPSNNRLAPLMQWVRTGGQLWYVRSLESELPQELQTWAQQRFLRERSTDYETYSCGLGSITLTAPGDAFGAGGQLLKLQEQLVNSRNFVPDRSGSHFSANDSPDVIEQPWITTLKQVPYKVFTVLLILFVILIGPVNFQVLHKRKKPQLLLITIPALALVASLGILAYGIFYQGIDIRTGSQTVSLLDQRNERVDTAEYRLLFAGVSPGPGLRPSAGTACFPEVRIWKPTRGNQLTPHNLEVQNLRIDFNEGTLLSNGYLPTRQRCYQSLLSDRTARQHLSVASTSDGLEIGNGFDTPLKNILLRDLKDRIYLYEDWLDPGESVRLKPTGVTPEQMRGDAQRGLQGQVAQAARLIPAEMNPFGEAKLASGCYLASMKQNPFRDECGVEAQIEARDRTHRLVGILSLEEAQW